MELGLRGRVAIVTGGSMGIGRACIEAFSGQGVKVATCARSIDALRQVAEEISSKTETEILPFKADVTNPEDVKRFVAAAYDKFGRIDILVPAAVNFVLRSSFLEYTDEHWWNHFNTKVIGCVRCTKEVLPYMKERKWGRIINMAGSAARGGGGTAGGTNPAIINFTKVLSDEVAKDGITVNAIHPTTRGATRGGTEIDGATMRDEERARYENISLEELKAQSIRRFAERPGPQVQAEDSGNMLLFLASDRAAAITGQTISVSGGLGQGVYY